MFYEPKNGHGLPWDPFKAIVAPRPIGWISTVDANGRPNLAPYSFFTIVQGSPPMVAFASEGLKDTAANAKATGEFVFNLATRPLAEAMNMTSANVDGSVDEFALAGLSTAPSHLVKPPRVADSPSALECRVVHFLALSDERGVPTDGYLVIGQVVGVHLQDRFIRDGRFDTALAQPIARCGYRDYATVEGVFELLRPADRPEDFARRR
jgi:flavin reductase (DIM6/NTAB) family NADH-FMN oxidoreductase RutF